MNLESAFIAKHQGDMERTELMKNRKRFVQIKRTFRPRTGGL